MQELTHWLIGAPGQAYVVQTLGKLGPIAGIAHMQEHFGLQHPLTPPLLAMLDTVGTSRADAHQYVLAGAKRELLARIAALPSADENRGAAAALESLLEASFAFLGVDELCEVPLSCMAKMQEVPARWLKMLAQDREVFERLPANVKQQVCVGETGLRW